MEIYQEIAELKVEMIGNLERLHQLEKKAIGLLPSHESRKETIKSFVNEVVSVTGNNIFTDSRKQSIVGTKYVILYLLRSHYSYTITLQELANSVGFKDHSMAIHGSEKAKFNIKHCDEMYMVLYNKIRPIFNKHFK